MRTSKAHTGLRTGFVWHRRWRAYAAPRQRCVVWNRGGSRMRESRTYGSVRGARGNSRPYRDRPLKLVACRVPAPPCPRVGAVRVGTAERESYKAGEVSAAFAHPTAARPPAGVANEVAPT